jgi:hypothetical protein
MRLFNTLDVHTMSLPSPPNAKHTFLPLVAEPHPRFDNTSRSTATNRCACTSPPKKTIASSQETQSWYHTPPPPPSVEVVVPEVEQDPPLQSSPSLPSHNDQLPTADAGEGSHAGEPTEGWKHLAASPWSVPHAVEHQKHAWYGSMLGMNAAKVKDDWGFHSASASRSHTPQPATAQ